MGMSRLRALKDWTFLFGPGLIVTWGNGLILGYLMHKSGLVPLRMAWFGLIGGPLRMFGSFGVLFDWWDAVSTIPSSRSSRKSSGRPSSGSTARFGGFGRTLHPSPHLARRRAGLTV